MNRERTAWLGSLVIIALLALRIPGSMGHRDDDYAFVRTLVDIHRQVSANYVEKVDEQALREGAIDGILEKLDPFTMYVPPAKQEEFDRMLEGSFVGVGIQLNMRDDGIVEVATPIEDSPAFKAGVMSGDLIMGVNGQSLEKLKLEEVIQKIKGQAGTEVTLTVKRVTGETIDLKMTRQEVIVPTVRGYARNADTTWDWYVSDRPRIGYIRITQFTEKTGEKVREALVGADGAGGLVADGLQGLILDLRFNPGGRLDQAVAILNLFLKKGSVVVSTRGRNRPETIQRAAGTALPNFPIIVLINEHSASASEIVAGSLLDNQRALVIGNRSFGKGSVQEVIQLDQKGGKLKLTTQYYYLPSGRLVHKKKDATDWGVEPQIKVPTTPDQERDLLKLRNELEQYRRPIAKIPAAASTMPTTGPTSASAVAGAATRPTDPQLERAVETMTGMLVLGDGRPPAVPSTTPTTRPAP